VSSKSSVVGEWPPAVLTVIDDLRQAGAVLTILLPDPAWKSAAIAPEADIKILKALLDPTFLCNAEIGAIGVQLAIRQLRGF